MDYRLIHVLFVLGMVVAIAVGAVLGDGHAVTSHSHMLAFADNTSICPDKQSGDCATLYILNGDTVPQNSPGFGPMPPARILAEPSDPILGISWSPDASTIAYLVGRRVIAGNFYVISTVDLWRVRTSTGASDLVAKDIASADEGRAYRLGDVIQWIGDLPAMGASDTWVRMTGGIREILSPDRKLVAARETGIDSSWICVRPPGSAHDAVRPGCFGDGFFSEPVWAPF